MDNSTTPKHTLDESVRLIHSSADEDEIRSRPKRWDKPFSSEMDDKMVEQVLDLAFFKQIDPNYFSKSLSLEGIIRNDTRLVTFKRNETIIRAGDYGNSAFLVLSGVVLTHRPPLQPIKPTSINNTVSDLKKYVKQKLFRSAVSHNTPHEESDTTTSDKTEVQSLHPGKLFGEIAAMTRTPRIATVVAQEDCELLEIRWQGLRDLRRDAEELRNHIDQHYRDRNMIDYLRSTPLFQPLSKEAMDTLVSETLFESYGNFDWHHQFNRLEHDPIGSEPLIAAEGGYADGMLIILSGFARLSRKYNHGEQSVAFLRSGDIYGLDTIISALENQSSTPSTAHPLPTYNTSLRALGYANVLRIPTHLVENVLRMQTPETIAKLAQPEYKSSSWDVSMLEFLMDNYYMNGTSAMMIDMERCVRCDDCVTACANTHDGTPLFTRQGKIHNNFMIANACMHCVDAVCLIGCPTGAIHRSAEKGEVIINEDTCIGCETCAKSCPYDNISMAAVRNQKGKPILDQKTLKPLLKATKCDRCVDSSGGPACERACPHDALIRVDMQSNHKLVQWFERRL